MASEKSPDPKPKHDLTSRRALLLGIYIFVLVVLARLYWPGWPFPDKSHPTANPAAMAAPETGPVAPPTTGTPAPQN